MGSNNTRTVKPRKATFTVKIVKGKREFTAVNRRAHIVAKKLGKRKYMTLAELRSTNGKGTYKFYAYDGNGKLAPIRF